MIEEPQDCARCKSPIFLAEVLLMGEHGVLCGDCFSERVRLRRTMDTAFWQGEGWILKARR